MILAIDIGTSSAKAARFSGSGECELLAEEPLAAIPPSEPLAGEIDAGAWASALAALARRLLADGSRPEAVAISGNGPTLLPVDAAGRPLHPALSWMDRRPAAEAAEASLAAGASIDASFCLPKALWFLRRRPELYERTAAFLSCPEYAAMLLSGERLSVVPAGYEKHYGERPSLEALGLDPAKFPPRVLPGASAGSVSAAGEAATGIRRGTPVFLAGPDFLAAILGTATTVPGRACDRAGSSEGINLCARSGVADPRLISVPHLVRPYANVSGSISSSGQALDWFKRASGQAEAGYEELFEELAASPPGARGLLFLPYLAGERSPIWDPLARGAFVGLGLEQGRAEMTRAVAESTALAMRDVIEVMEESGAPVGELRVSGKPGRSRAWNRIKADATGRPILLPRFAEAELFGCLCFALAGLGRSSSAAAAAEELVETGELFEPDPAARGLYDELFAAYREAYRALKPVFARLGRTASRERGEG